MRKHFLAGMQAGIPICVGYLSVSFGFGAMAVAQGLAFWQAVLISATNLTSAGQFAGLTVITAGATFLEMLLTQLVINSRYGLMSLALGQKFGPSVGIGKRLAAAFFNTDEVFALGMNQKKLTTAFFLGAGTVAALGWLGGTAAGALMGSLLPVSIRAALGVLLYGMFIAIVVPEAKKSAPTAICVAIAVALSCAFYYIPWLQSIPSGFTVIICAVVASVIMAALAPIPQEVEDDA